MHNGGPIRSLMGCHVLQGLGFEAGHAVEHAAAAQESQIGGGQNFHHILAVFALHDVQHLCRTLLSDMGSESRVKE